MSELFKWGFLAAMSLPWITLGGGALTLLLTRGSRAKHHSPFVERKRAA